MVLHNEASLMVEADISEEFVRDVSPGATARIIPIADPERAYEGTVVELAGLARLVNGENTVKTRIRLDERDGFLEAECGADDGLLAEVSELLGYHEEETTRGSEASTGPPVISL